MFPQYMFRSHIFSKPVTSFNILALQRLGGQQHFYEAVFKCLSGFFAVNNRLYAGSFKHMSILGLSREVYQVRISWRTTARWWGSYFLHDWCQTTKWEGMGKWVEVRQMGVQNSLVKKLTAPVSMHLGYGDWSLGHLHLYPCHCHCKGWSLHGMCNPCLIWLSSKSMSLWKLLIVSGLVMCLHLAAERLTLSFLTCTLESQGSLMWEKGPRIRRYKICCSATAEDCFL